LGAVTIASAAAGACVVAGLAVACGGSTGREGLTIPGQAEPGQADAGDDATTSPFDAGLFDVDITYAERSLPDISAPPEAGRAEAGYPWPSCPPFINVDFMGQPVAPGTEIDQVPSAYADDGGVVFAPDGSPCATYGWLGSTAIDECMTSNNAGGSPTNDFAFLPPCNWVAEAGVAVEGARKGDSRYAICLDLYVCIVDSGCALQNSQGCLCGSATPSTCNASGPCGAQELAALEERADTIQDALKNYTATGGIAGFRGAGGSQLNYVYGGARSYECFDAGAK
jgi:hypothetical protein